MTALFRKKKDASPAEAYGIRPLTPDDFAALLRYDWSPLMAERDTIYLFLARDHSRYCFAAEGDPGEVLGYLVSARSADGKSVFVVHVHVRPAARRRGIGKALMCELERTAREDGVETVWLLARAQIGRFYAKLGYGPADDLLPEEAMRYVRKVKRTGVMVKRLAPGRGVS